MFLYLVKFVVYSCGNPQDEIAGLEVHISLTARLVETRPESDPTYALTMFAIEGASGVHISMSSFQTLSATVSEFARVATLSK